MSGREKSASSQSSGSRQGKEKDGLSLWEPVSPRERKQTEAALTFLREKGLATFLSAHHRWRGLPSYFALLQRAWEIRYEDPGLMVDLALVAVVTAQSLDPAAVSPVKRADYECRATIELANACRVADRLDQASGALGEAAELFRQGSGDLRLKARLFDVQASWLADRRNFRAACDSLEMVRSIHLELGNRHLAGRALISKGLYSIYDNRPEDAVALIRQGMEQIDTSQDPTLFFIATHNLGQSLIDLGRYREARSLLWTNEQRFGGSMGRVSRLKLNWLKARIDVSLGENRRAEERLQEVRNGFREEGLHYKEALATLELALVASLQGRAQDTRTLAAEAAKVFLSVNVPREAAGAVMLLEHAIDGSLDVTAFLTWIFDLLRAADEDPSFSLREWLGRLL